MKQATGRDTQTARSAGALEFLRTRTEDVCMFVDGHDSFILAGANHIINQYNSCLLAGLVISCEKTCWPDPEIASRYPNLQTKSPFLYPNAGGWIGDRTQLIKTLQTMVECGFSMKWPDDDQRCWHEYCDMTQGFVVYRDTECRIFQTMGGTGEIDETGKNLVTLNYPLVWHFNGRTSGREEWYQKLTGDKL